MNVLRENRDSVMAMLEAFVYDPLITWRLLNNRDDADANLSGNDEDMSESRDAASAPDAIDKLRDHIASSLLGGGVLEAGAASIRVHGGTRMDGGGGMSMAASTMRDLTTAGKIIANGAADGSEPITEENVNAR